MILNKRGALECSPDFARQAGPACAGCSECWMQLENLYTPVQSAFQTQGGGMSRLEREDLLESHRQKRGVGVGWAHGGGHFESPAAG